MHIIYDSEINYREFRELCDSISGRFFFSFFLIKKSSDMSKTRNRDCTEIFAALATRNNRHFPKTRIQDVARRAHRFNIRGKKNDETRVGGKDREKYLCYPSRVSPDGRLRPDSACSSCSQRRLPRQTDGRTANRHGETRAKLFAAAKRSQFRHDIRRDARRRWGRGSGAQEEGGGDRCPLIVRCCHRACSHSKQRCDQCRPVPATYNGRGPSSRLPSREQTQTLFPNEFSRYVQQEKPLPATPRGGDQASHRAADAFGVRRKKVFTLFRSRAMRMRGRIATGRTSRSVQWDASDTALRTCQIRRAIGRSVALVVADSNMAAVRSPSVGQRQRNSASFIVRRRRDA